MKLTHFGHACVRVQDGDQVLVIDPGTFSDAEAALSGATAVLVSHEHPDHVDVEALKAARAANPALTVHTHAALAAELGEEAVAVAADETFTAAGFTVKAVGGMHAEVIDGLPGCPNLGYLVNGLYHPGDSLFVPAEEVGTLLVPAAGPWVKISDAISFVRAVRPARAFPIHDIQLSKIGLEYFDAWLEEETDYARIAVGASVDL
ncbi:L-ascorbate metabolism protein UlaG (beta-lactamase superfamily) [Kibdelosporangium banguiense]|uniref:L-ascorbate metabolism protein UlaG (Beta-lactamase superfamily) n=1 Tax=Kibdelosporangium banguiense TaxID=1365924 RepID=A0ABS4TTV9_9PSEU|nr:MBL fold metallo-hydrolase [Kibdelosporangium banguiense]MBP2327386.1 L-ascorbate metabolism protein UlaG (beta-lactamase superfamily) [Kibdelosporangium banguiense]